jgi:4-diphosphocytidyl-2-C-methyl-D-erythritol kinase
MLKVKAPAKINLTLEVLSKRDDGYHEIRSIIQTITLCDELCFQESEGIEFKCDLPDWLAEKSLVTKAASLLKETTGSSRGASITINKHIPLLSGLGGDSSDAMATLRGLNQFWNMGLSQDDLLKLARQLGSDVSFFLYGGTALLTGRGEMVTPLPPVPHEWVVVALPQVPRLPNKTREMYASLKVNHFTDGQITRRLMDELKAGNEFNDALLFNTFENIAFDSLSNLGVSRSHMVKMGATNVHLAGSGPALFTLIKERAEAEDLCHRLEQQRLAPHLAETMAAYE